MRSRALRPRTLRPRALRPRTLRPRTLRSRTLGGLGVLALGFGCALIPAAPAGADADDAAAKAKSAEKALRTATVEAERQADLVAGEDQRVMEALVAGLPTREHPKARGPYRTTSSGLNLVLTKRRNPYTFDDLRKLAPDTLVPQAKGSFLLRENIIVGPGATLSITPNQPLKIKMRSGPDGFVSVITQGGQLRLNGTPSAPISFESWDVSRGRSDTDVADGRAYVRASGLLVAKYTAFTRLGFWSGRTGGVSVVGSGSSLGQDLDAGAVVADKAAADPVAEAGSGKAQLLPTGKLPAAAQDPEISYGTQISNSTMTGNAFGLFVTGNSGARIEDTVIRKSLVDGLVLHRDVDSANVKNVRVEKSGSDGVVVSRKVEGTVLTQLVVKQNGRDGIVLAGRPLASGPSASGSSTRAFGNNWLTASQSTDNVRIGIHVIGGTSVRVQGNTVNGGRSGIVVSDGATEVDIDSNRVAGAAANGIQVRESRKIMVTGNVVRNAQTGIHVRNASGTFRQNSTSGVTLHGITFVGAVTGSVAGENLLSGSGTSAIDVVRVTDEQTPKLEENDLSGWSQTVTGDSLLSVLLHPLTVIWMLVALLLLGMSRPRRGGGGLPYRADPLIPGGTLVIGSASAVEPSRERENPVLEIPERPVPVLAQNQPVAHPTPNYQVQPWHPAAQPAQQARPSQPSRPAQPVHAAQPLRPTEPAQPVSAAHPAQPARVAQPAQPVSAARPAAQPGPSAVPVQPLRPGSPQSARPWTPSRGPLLSPLPVSQPPTDPRPEVPAGVDPDQRRSPAWEHESRPGAEHETEPERGPAPVGRVGSAVIDLAIREARLNPAAPRRRRVNGR
jgi:hypothetical protein